MNLKKPSPAHLARNAEEQRSKTREERTFDILCGTYATLVSRIRECLDEGRIEDAKTRLEDLHAVLRN